MPKDEIHDDDVQEIELQIGITIGWRTDNGQFFVDASALSAPDAVYYLDQAIKRLLDASSPDRVPEKKVQPARVLPGPGGRNHH